MEVFTVEEWENNFDELFARVENGETIGIVKEDGQAAVMMPADEADFIRIHTEENNDADQCIRECRILVNALCL